MNREGSADESDQHVGEKKENSFWKCNKYISYKAVPENCSKHIWIVNKFVKKKDWFKFKSSELFFGIPNEYIKDNK